MALIVGGYVGKRTVEYRREEGSSDLYLEVDSEYLDAYDIKEGDKLIGKILEVGRCPGESEYPDLEEKEVSFIVGGIRGRIYLSERDWLMFRDRGLIKSGFWLNMRFSKAIIEGKEIEIYPKADVKG
ncbi:MAG: hypothetical protein ACXQTW_05650 [Candidatus Methanospirareceae archaeon]